MDDPRSAYCVNRDDSSKNMTALSAKVRGFKTRLEFLDWIKTDADKILASETSNQISKYKFNKSFAGKVINKIASHIATRQPA